MSVRTGSSVDVASVADWLNAVANRNEYIERLKLTVEQLHKCSAVHIGTDHVHDGQTAWQGDVEIFEIKGHPQTKWCYAWSHKDDQEEKLTAVLQIPPVISSLTAVRASIVAGGKKGNAPAVDDAG